MDAKRILVTGGAGYLGSVLCSRLLTAGHRVTVIDSLIYGQNSLFRLCADDGFEFIRGDARDSRLLTTALKQADVIIPLAALVGASACDRDPAAARGVNLEAVVLLNRLRSREQWVLSPCTNSGYGAKTGDVYCDEDTPMEPISLYGETKVQAENELLAAPNTLSLRLATVFGPSPRMRFDLLVNDFTQRACSDGFLVIYEKDFKRNYVHIDDVADAFCFCLEHFPTMSGAAYNVGLDDANLSKAELAAAIKVHVPRLYVHFAEIGSDPDKRNYIVSNARLARHGFTARRSLDVGIRQLVRLCRMLPVSPFRNA